MSGWRWRDGESGYHNERYPWGCTRYTESDSWLAWLSIGAFFALIAFLSSVC